MDKIFKYIDDRLHGYIPTNNKESQELIEDGWSSSAEFAYETRGTRSAQSDDDFRRNANEALKQVQ